jgi:hypothetical protein
MSQAYAKPSNKPAGNHHPETEPHVSENICSYGIIRAQIIRPNKHYLQNAKLL